MSRQGVWAAIGRKLGLAIALYGLLPGGFLTIYLLGFNAPSSAVVPHLAVAGGLLAAIAGTRLVLSFAFKNEKARLATSALLVACMALSMLAYYGLVFVGLKFWGRVTTAELASTYVHQMPAFLRSLGYAPGLATLVGGAIVGLAWIAAYRYLKKNDWVSELRTGAISAIVALLLGFGLVAIAVLSAIGLPDHLWGNKGEPISLSLFPDQANTAMQSHSIDVFLAAKLDREEELARKDYKPAGPAGQKNVVLIVADALRADHLSLFGYSRKTSPYLDALASAKAVRLATSATAVCNESSCGLRAIASSRYLDRQATKPITVQEALKLHGYRVHLMFSGDHTNFYGLSDIYGEVDSYFDGASQKERYLNDDRLVTDRLSSVAGWDGRPTMFQFHLMSSHALGARFEDTPPFGPGGNYTALRWGTKDLDAPARATNYYDQGILQADRMIANILELLSKKGYLKDALVVVTGDHGESLGERGLYSHTHSVWEESLQVPFILLQFGGARKNQIDAGPVVSQVDIAPTLLHELDLPIPSSWEGNSLQRPSAHRVAYFQQAQFIGLVDGRDTSHLYKHWLDLRTGQKFTFDLSADPHERNNLTAQVTEPLKREWQQLLASRSAALAPEVAARLNAPAVP